MVTFFSLKSYAGDTESRIGPSHALCVTHMVRYSASLVSGRGRHFRSGWYAAPWPGASNGRPDTCPFTLSCMEVIPVSRPTIRRRCLRELPARCVTGRWTSAYFDRIDNQDGVSDLGACYASHCAAKPVLYLSVWLMLSLCDPCANRALTWFSTCDTKV